MPPRPSLGGADTIAAMAAASLQSLAAVVPALRCPHCSAPVELAERAVVCESGHRYDVARQGYVSLFPPTGPPPTADSAAMVAARDSFLGAGHYGPVADGMTAVAEAAAGGASATGTGAAATPDVLAVGVDGQAELGADGAPGDREPLVVDVGAGTGWHLAAVLERLAHRRGLALDGSRDALRRAVRAHPRIAGVACDAWSSLPVRDGAASLVLSVFAPRQAAELARVLAPGGALIVVTPGQSHLRELVGPLGMLGIGADKRDRLRDSLAPQLEPESARVVEFTMTLARADARALVAMGPSAHHVTPDELERRLGRLPDPVAVTASVVVETFRRRAA